MDGAGVLVRGFAMRRFPRLLILICSTIVLSTSGSCSNGSSSGQTGGGGPGPQTGVEEYTTIDISNPFNYENPSWPIHYDLDVFLSQDNTPPGNPITNDGATLGRVLFFDKRLSINDARSCASCHTQSLGLTDPVPFSVGHNGVDVTGAHSMRLGNARFYGGIRFFWDKRAATLEEQTTMPIQDTVEMGFDTANGGLPSLFSKMATLPYYPEFFDWVYGDSMITEDRMQRAIAQYIRSMASIDSRWDDGLELVYDATVPDKGVFNAIPGFTAEEDLGKDLFFGTPTNPRGLCGGCHIAPTLTFAFDSLSNGLDAGETTVFKAPSLKNVGLTGPYMHDGRFDTLEEVVEHYNSGVQEGPALDPTLRDPITGLPQQLNLTQVEKDALVAFLHTLDDPVLTTDPRFSNPFKK